MKPVQRTHIEPLGMVETSVWALLAANSRDGRLPSALFIATLTDMKWIAVFEAILVLAAQGYISKGRLFVWPSLEAIREAKATTQQQHAKLKITPFPRVYRHNSEGDPAA